MRKRVALVLAGDTVDESWLTLWLSQADLILSADGGGDLVHAAGFQPDILLGDLDSASAGGRANAKRVIELSDQNSTDCEKLLAYASETGVESAVVLGARGHRIDHMLGTMQAVARWPGRAMIAYERQLLRIIRGPAAEQLPARGILSALPLDPCEGVSMEQVRWPLDRVAMSPTGFSSVSNHAEGEARVTVEEGTLAVFWDYDGKPDWTPLSRS